MNDFEKRVARKYMEECESPRFIGHVHDKIYDDSDYENPEEYVHETMGETLAYRMTTLKLAVKELCDNLGLPDNLFVRWSAWMIFVMWIITLIDMIL